MPKRIQHKYFFKIRQLLLTKFSSITDRKNKTTTSNRITNTYIRFSYKRYRFCFGFYEAYDYLINDPTLNSNNNTKCSIPSSIVLSQGRKACTHYQTHIFKQADNKNREHLFLNSLLRVNDKWRSKEYGMHHSQRKG